MEKDRELLQCTKFKVISRSLVLPNGLACDRELVVHPGAVVIVPVSDTGELIMLKQYRWAVRQYIVEFPAGTLEKGEALEVCAHRELLEETGFEAKSMVYLGAIVPSPGFCDEIQHLYVAKGLTFVGSNPEPGEILEELKISTAKFTEMVKNAEIVDCKTIAAFTKAQAMGYL